MAVTGRAGSLQAFGSVAVFAAVTLVASCTAGPVTAVAVASDTLWNGLVAHYTFDENGGIALPDHSGNGRDGELHGPDWASEGRFGGAMKFDYGTFVSVQEFPDATPGWTVAAWLKLPAGEVPTQRYVAVLSTEVVFQGGWQLNITPGPSVHFGFWTGPGTYDFTYLEQRFQDDVWTHVAGVVDGNNRTITLYVNGVMVARKGIARAILPGSRVLSMGTWSGVAERYYAGLLDDVVIYARALAAEEVWALTEHPVPDPQ